jgi:ribonuclease III
MLDDLAKSLGRDFKDMTILVEATTHGSAGKARRNYERLEFLGDRVLSLVIADMLLTRFPSEPEGDLARRHAALVRRETLADVARETGLGAYISFGKGEAESGGKDNPSILADVCEAVIAALYLDGGLEVAVRWIKLHWADRMTMPVEPPKDAKTALQEWAQGRGLPAPVYTVLSRVGPDHAPVFNVGTEVDGFPSAHGEGPSKRVAEQNAAAALMDNIVKDPSNIEVTT